MTSSQMAAYGGILKKIYSYESIQRKPYKPLSLPVTLDAIKKHLKLSNIALIKQSRLSVMPLTKNEFKFILVMGNTKISGL